MKKIRSHRPTIDEYFMDVARLLASRSTCVRRSVGCVLVDSRNHVLATGYNGVAAGEAHCNDVEIVNAVAPNTLAIRFPSSCPGSNAESGKGLDSCNAIHAEQNALLQCADVHAIDRAYVTAFPCPTCLKLLLNTSCRVIAYGQEYGDMAGWKLWIKAGRLAHKVDGEPHMIQADLVNLFGPADGLNEWRVALACVCLNLASARVARGIVFRILQRWPDPATLARSGDDLERVLHPLGLSERRAFSLREMSKAQVDGLPYTQWTGVGPYGQVSVQVFVHGYLPDDVCDRKVAAYVEWKRAELDKVAENTSKKV